MPLILYVRMPFIPRKIKPLRSRRKRMVSHFPASLRPSLIWRHLWWDFQFELFLSCDKLGFDYEGNECQVFSMEAKMQLELGSPRFFVECLNKCNLFFGRTFFGSKDNGKRPLENVWFLLQYKIYQIRIFRTASPRHQFQGCGDQGMAVSTMSTMTHQKWLVNDNVM